jgi:hypothetical protein
MPAKNSSPDFLTSKQEIIDFIGGSEHTFWEYIRQGMPALYFNRHWSASAKAIENWWYTTRNVPMKFQGLDKIMQEDKEVVNGS